MTTPLYEDLCALAPRAKKSVLKELADAAPEILPSYGINTTLREAHFWAQAAHETGGFKFLREIWGPTPAQQKYEGRKDLGNVEPGDGRRFAGRGIFQLTGRANYAHYGKLLDLDLVADPELAADPVVSLRIACEYWKSRKINACADADDVVAVTRKINGGTNGIADRRVCLATAKKMWADNNDTIDVPVAPKPEKSIVESKQATGGLAVGGLAALGAAKEIQTQVADASDLATTIGSAASNTSLLILLAVAAVGFAIVYWRKKHMEEYGT